MVMQTCKTRWIIAVLLLLHLTMLSWSAERHSPVQSEDAHLAAGIIHFHRGQFDLYRVNPPLVRSIGALPVLWAHPKLEWNLRDMDSRHRYEHQVGAQLSCQNQSRTAWLVCLARWMCVGFSLWGGWICCLWACRLYGQLAGGLALILWCFCPWVLGYATTIMPDAHAAAMGAAAIYCFWRWLKKPEGLEAILAGMVLGLAELCKFTLLVFYPLLPAVWFVYRLPDRKTMALRDWLRQGGLLVTTLLVSICVLNCGYLFEGTFTPLESFRFQSVLFTGATTLKAVPAEGTNRFAGTWLGKVPVPLPANMVQGIDAQRYDFERGLPSYLRGEWAAHGWWYYYLYALAIKIPLGTWCLVAIAAGLTVFGRGYSVAWRDELVLLAPLGVLLIFVSSQTGFSVHSRYVTPILPFLFVWTSKVAWVFETRSMRGKRLAIALIAALALIWSIGSSLANYPHSLSYFNELAALLPTPADDSYPTPARKASSDGKRTLWEQIHYVMVDSGPRNGPRHLLDSNVDWGQDLFYLKDWLDKHPDVRLTGLAYWGSYPVRFAGVPETRCPSSATTCEVHGVGTTGDDSGPKPGWYALSVNRIYSRERQYRYFLHFEPLTMAGYSIYIYHITLDDANRVRRKLGLPDLEVNT